MFHFSRGSFLGHGPVADAAQWGYLGVDAFFVISGFVIPLALRASRFTTAGLFGFLRARWFRLYPAFIATSALTIVLWYASALTPGFKGAPPAFTARQLISNATLTSEILGEAWLVPVFWTLAVEAQYYIALALAFPLLTSARPIVRVTTVVAWISAPLLFPLRASFLPYGALFGLGIVAFLQLSALLSRSVGSGLALLAVVVQWCCGGYASAIVAAVSYGVIVYLPQLRSPPLVALGTLSYSLYLVHVPIGGRVINLGDRWATTFTGKALWFGAAFVVSLLFAALLHWLIEKPAHEFARRLWGRAPRARETKA